MVKREPEVIDLDTYKIEIDLENIPQPVRPAAPVIDLSGPVIDLTSDDEGTLPQASTCPPRLSSTPQTVPVAGPSESSSSRHTSQPRTKQESKRESKQETTFRPRFCSRSGSGPPSSLNGAIANRWEQRDRSQTLRGNSAFLESFIELPPLPQDIQLGPGPSNTSFPSPATTQPPVPSDAEEEYDYIHAGYDVMDNSRWKPSTCMAEDDLSHSPPKATYLLPAREMHRPPQPTRGHSRRRLRASGAVWSRLASVDPWFRTAILPGRKSIRHTYNMRLHPLLFPDKMVVRKYAGVGNQASGPVNKIIQANGLIVACSAALGGAPDEEDEPLPPVQNQPGSMIVLRDNQIHQLDGHSRDFGRRQELQTSVKHYTVHDLAVDPGPASFFVTSGNDQQARVWKIIEEAPGLELYTSIFCDAIPHDVSFRASGSVLAVSCEDGNIYVYPNLDDTAVVCPFNVAPNDTSDHATGATVWGHGCTDHLLFASSEPRDNTARAYHRAFDVRHQRMVFEFDAIESGDSIAIDPDGERLALITQHGNGTHFLRVYDIRTGRQAKTCGSVPLARISPIPNAKDPCLGEVNCAVYSPDGVLLAVAQNDNRTHVYDSRVLGRGSLFNFPHQQDSSKRSPKEIAYGVVHAEWTTMGGHLGLVTGGNDGCVRLWDTSLANDDPSNGAILARSNWDIGYFTLGRHPDEKPLVVGDCGGHFLVWDYPYG